MRRGCKIEKRPTFRAPMTWWLEPSNERTRMSRHSWPLRNMMRRLYENGTVNCCNRAWLLKNSFTQNSQKKLCDKKPYKRRSPICWAFTTPKISAVLAKQEFFNRYRRLYSHCECFRLLSSLSVYRDRVSYFALSRSRFASASVSFFRVPGCT